MKNVVKGLFNKKILLVIVFLSLLLFVHTFSYFTSSKKISINKRQTQEYYNLTLENARKAIIETAKAFSRRGVNMQYDSFRRNDYASPEDATSQNYVYSVCSAYTFQTYFQTFGIEIPRYTESLDNYANKISKTDNRDNLLFYCTADEECSIGGEPVSINDDNFAAVFNNYFKTKVAPGDIINIRRNTGTGHAMLISKIEGDDIYLIESGGSTYEADNYTEKYENTGTIKNLANLRTIKDMLIKEKTKLASVSIIRFITNSMTYPDPNNEEATLTINDLTPAAKTRLAYPDLNITKEYVIDNEGGNNRVVRLGDEINYIIKITNNSNETYGSLVVNEQLSNLVTYTEEQHPNNTTFTNNGDELNWSINSIDPNEEIKVSYKVKVTSDTKYLDSKIISTGNVGNIRNATITHKIGLSLTSTEENQIVDSYNNIKNNNDKNDLDFIKDIYSFADLTSMSDMINDKLYENTLVRPVYKLINYEFQDNKDSNNNSYKTVKYNVDDKISDIVVTNLYGIKLITSGSSSNIIDDTTTPVTVPYLVGTSAWRNTRVIGGILNYMDYELENRSSFLDVKQLLIGDILLIYNNDTTEAYIYLGNNTLARRSSNLLYEIKDNGTYTNGSKTADLNITTFLNNTVGKTYLVLRPALTNYINVERIILTPEKNEIKIGETINVNSEVLPANATIRSFVLESSNPDIAKVENNTITGLKEGTTFIKAFIENKDGTSIGEFFSLRVKSNDSYSLTVKHLIKNSFEAFDETIITPKVYGEDYTTTPSSKASPISYYDITIPANATGKITGNIVVTYFYKIKTGLVVVKHLDKDGNYLANAPLSVHNYGEHYTSSPIDSLKEKYTVRIPADKSGVVNKNYTEVIYYYYPKDDQKVNFEAEIDGEDVIKEVKDKYSYKLRVTANYKDYVDKSNIKTIYNLPYEINEEASSLDGGVYNADEKTITWEEEIEVDSYNQDTYNFEKEITVQYKNIDYEQGLMMNSLHLEADNKYVSTTTMHQTEFEIPAKIIIKYLDESGNELMDSEEINDLVGNTIEIKEKEIEGYKIVGYPTQTKYTLEEQTLIYTYAKNEVVTVENTAQKYPLYFYIVSVIEILVGALIITSGLQLKNSK